MKRLHAQIWWLLQYPVWWIAPNSLLFYSIRAKYARVVGDWLNSR